jgi:hypothetical protein
MCCFLNFITCLWNSTSFLALSPWSLCVRDICRHKVSPARLIQMHHPALAVNFTSIWIWLNSSSALMHTTSHIIGKPSLCFSCTALTRGNILL